MTDLSNVKFFVTPQHRCSYLPRQDAVTLFADPKINVNGALYGELSELGFRRSGNYLYRPHCRQCTACVPVRIPVERFSPSRRQKRILKRNQDLEIAHRPATYTDEDYDLYCRYIEQRHSDGDMYPPSHEQYNSFLLSEWSSTRFYEFRHQGTLLAVAVCDIMNNGLSAVYTFFDPDQAKRSLGVMGVLWQIEEAKRMELPDVYLGYWIKECEKMSYKTEYRPMEMFINQRWTQIT